jgi:hypothetical protein
MVTALPFHLAYQSAKKTARHDMGLSTVIGRTDRDASGQKIDAQMCYLYLSAMDFLLLPFACPLRSQLGNPLQSCSWVYRSSRRCNQLARETLASCKPR